jgi:hypothetical protein
MDVVIGFFACILDIEFELFDGVFTFIFKCHVDGALNKVGKEVTVVLFKCLFKILNTKSMKGG